MNLKMKRVFKRALAMELVERGHRVLKIEDNKINSGYMVYVFENSFALVEDMYLANKKLS
ncbi:hypothetical protein M3699_04710 [Peribacillus simplex]|uniref:hypothetical protein n=1 Tax=Peribacillus simplex TaxID=1478 RepID=UPI0020413EE9|nr:hypothetical protein [Peribacillus simplex]MCM3673195.1 hypothetical protein [Peribacillus simplex]